MVDILKCKCEEISRSYYFITISKATGMSMNTDWCEVPLTQQIKKYKVCFFNVSIVLLYLVRGNLVIFLNLYKAKQINKKLQIGICPRIVCHEHKLLRVSLLCLQILSVGHYTEFTGIYYVIHIFSFLNFLYTMLLKANNKVVKYSSIYINKIVLHSSI